MNGIRRGGLLLHNTTGVYNIPALVSIRRVVLKDYRDIAQVGGEMWHKCSLITLLSLHFPSLYHIFLLLLRLD